MLMLFRFVVILIMVVMPMIRVVVSPLRSRTLATFTAKPKQAIGIVLHHRGERWDRDKRPFLNRVCC